MVQALQEACTTDQRRPWAPCCPDRRCQIPGTLRSPCPHFDTTVLSLRSHAWAPALPEAFSVSSKIGQRLCKEHVHVRGLHSQHRDRDLPEPRGSLDAQRDSATFGGLGLCGFKRQRIWEEEEEARRSRRRTIATTILTMMATVTVVFTMTILIISCSFRQRVVLLSFS